MTVAAAHYDKFKEQAVEDGRVFTFTADGDYLIFPVGRHEVIPFWSSRSRMEKVQAEHPKYLQYQIKEMALAEFVDWLPNLASDGVRVGTNWSGKRLTGYDVETSDLLAGLRYWLGKKEAAK